MHLRDLGDLADLKAALAEDGWISSIAKLTRPLAVTMTIAILPIGGFVIGTVSAFNADRGLAMAANSVAFFKGLPEALYWMVGGIATGYFGAKAFETRSPPPPEGRSSPEGPAASTATPAIDEAIADVVDRAKPDPTMRDSAIAAGDYPAGDPAAFDEDAAPLALFGLTADELRAAGGLDRLPRPAFGQVEGDRFETKELVL